MRFREAADFAAGVEEISRTLEYLQVVAAGAVDRTRSQAISVARSCSAVGWTTGWGNQTAVHGPIGWLTGQTGPADGGQGTEAAADSGTSNWLRRSTRTAQNHPRKNSGTGRAPSSGSPAGFAPRGILRHPGPVRTPPGRDEHRHQPPHPRPGARRRRHGRSRELADGSTIRTC
jgi:hypothetical protein